MKRWTTPIIITSLGVLAVLSALGIALASGDDDPADAPGDGSALGTCLPGVPDCADMGVGDDGSTGGTCLAGAPDCGDTGAGSDGSTGGDLPPVQGIAVGEPNPAAPGGFQDPVTAGRVPARIDAVEVVVRESAPPQYAVQVTSGLPNGCAAFGETSVSREGNTIRIAVINEVGDDGGSLACTMVYGQVVTSVDLGSDFIPGETYTVVVNEYETTFLAQ